MFAPICLFTYNRLSETQQTVEALKCNYLAKESELYVFSDGPKDERVQPNVETVRKYIHCINGFKSVYIFESKENHGLANSIIYGVSKVLEKYDKIIVLEDDLISTANFLSFMNQALNFYQPNKNIQSISGFSLSLKDKENEIYFQIRPGSWGWATWKDRWNIDIFNKEQIRIKINSDSSMLKKFRIKCGDDMPRMLLDSINHRNDSWYVRWAFDHLLNNHYSVFPNYSYIQNIGFGREGIHCKGINPYTAETVDDEKIRTEFSDFKTPDAQRTKQFLYYFTFRHKFLFRIRLLRNKQGRIQIVEELKVRIGFR